MLQDSSELVQDPTESIDGKAHLWKGEMVGIPLRHECDVETEKDDELQNLQDVSRPRDDETVLVEQRRLPWVIERDGLLLVAVWNEV
jgi:hypothetical protein